ncbi:MAG: phosphotransferase, partial [Actinobacteria bacterium]|nr:phosphotransferase [Actinomycetota bacterium]
YEDNAVYSVGTYPRYVLRISLQNGRTLAEQQSEIEWLEHLKRLSSPKAPTVVQADDGSSVGQVFASALNSQVTYVLFNWIAGSILSSYNSPKTAQGLAMATAQLHLASEDFSPSIEFTRPSWSYKQILNSGYAATGKRARDIIGLQGVDLMRRVGDRVAAQLSTKKHRSGLIHADLHRENVLVNKSQYSFIDFDDCGEGCYMLDVATTLASAFRVGSDQNTYQTFANRYLNAYEELRSIAAEMEEVDVFLVLRDAIILNFVIESQNPTVASWRQRRATGILEAMNFFLDTGSYLGGLHYIRGTRIRIDT